MSSPAPLAEAAHDTQGHDHAHPSHLAHHFETSEQQFDSGKLGIWLFLTTEVLLFAGLFCAYAACRAHNFEILEYAHKYLSVFWGALNTVVLIFSSFTMAWAVRCSQLGKTKALCTLLIITLLCGLVFLGVKGIEYKNKWDEGLLPGQHYKPTEGPPKSDIPEVKPEAKADSKSSAAAPAPTVPTNATPGPTGAPMAAQANAANSNPAPLSAGANPSTGAATSLMPANAPPKDSNAIEHSQILPAAVGPTGISKSWLERQQAVAEHKYVPENEGWKGREPDNVQLFFGIYFAMTGLHGLHVIAGMCAITWVLLKARRNEFGPDYFEPVDFVGLYWHLVDLVWIFLFPLLYLIS